MPSDWDDVTIDSIASHIAMGPFGSDIKTDNYVSSGVPVIRGNNLTSGRFQAEGFAFLTEEKADELANANAVPGDLVFTHRGTLGQVGIVPVGPYSRYVVSQSQMKLTCDSEKVSPLFLYYFFESPIGQHALLMHTSQTGVPAISQPVTSLKAIRIGLPPLSEQRAIAHVLGTIDDKIELNRRLNETLDDMAGALFKSWFADFNPVRAKGDGRWRMGESLPGLPAELYELFPGRLVKSELGDVPEGWEVVGLNKAVEINPTRRLKKGAVVPYLEMANMPTRGHVPEAVVDRPYGSGTRFMNGDTLLARITPSLENGKTAYVDFLDDDQVGWGSTEYIVLRARSPLPAPFAYCLARHEPFRQFAIRTMTGSSGRQRVRTSALEHYRLAVPPDPRTGQRFGELVAPLLERAAEGAKESRVLAELRDALLPRLISGEIRVGDAEHIAGRLA